MTKNFNNLKHSKIDTWQNNINLLNTIPKVEITNNIGMLNFPIIFDKSINLRKKLKEFRPWRKGPYMLGDIIIESEWNCALKWQRLKKFIGNIEGKKVLDIGASSGYFSFQISLFNPKIIVALEPFTTFYHQLLLLNTLLKKSVINPLSIRFEKTCFNNEFDLILSLGVIYHQKSPIQHLLDIKKSLVKGGKLIIETLIVDGSLGYSLLPENRYANMPNVWFIPSVKTMISWLKRTGFDNINCFDITQTTSKEQQKTDWLGDNSKSLADFVDFDKKCTNEKLPMPTRALFVCNKL